MPNLFIIAGCNGAGKTTAYPNIIEKIFGIRDFVNADIIAKQMSDSDPDSMAISAGREFYKRIEQLINDRYDFSFETTLASKTLVNVITRCNKVGYNVYLIFFWLDNYKVAIDRVKNRVMNGGHNIPSDVIERRYYRGIKNLIEIYIPISDYWMVIDNTAESEIISEGEKLDKIIIYSEQKWNLINIQ